MNKALISCAGSGKTTTIINETIDKKNKRILITTYTDENTIVIYNRITKKHGYIPSNIDITPFFSFLLEHGVRPYQNYVYEKRIDSLAFIPQPRFIPENNIKHYITENNSIYRDNVSKFILKLNAFTKGLIIKRLEKIYDYIYIDEFQDLSGYDLDFIELLLQSSINIFIVGDPRQSTFYTTNSRKNKKYKGKNIVNKIEEWKKKGIIDVEYNNDCHRCCQKICDFSNVIFPDFEKMISRNMTHTSHDGVFIITSDKVDEYIKKYNPQLLRYSKNSSQRGLNFGKCKGQEFERVLIFPTESIKKYLKTGDINKLNSKEKFFVALTRAKQSVAIVYDGDSPLLNLKYYD